MITLITGPQGSGKTTKARELTKGRNAAWLEESKLGFQFTSDIVDSPTEAIVIDEATDKDQIINLITAEFLKIESPGGRTVAKHIPLPDVIICSQTITLDDLPAKYIDIEVIRCENKYALPKDLNENLYISSILISGFEEDDTVATVEFVYMNEFWGNAIYKKGRSSYSWFETNGIPDSLHNAIEEEIEECEQEIVEILNLHFAREMEEAEG